MSRLSRDAVEKQVARRANSLAKRARQGAPEPLLVQLARMDIALEEGLVTLRQAMADRAPRAEVKALEETLNKLATRWQVLAFSAGILKDTVARRRSKKEEELEELRRLYYGDDSQESDDDA